MYRVRRQISVSCKLLLQVGTWGLIYKISYDNLTIMLKLRSTYDGPDFKNISCKAFLRYDSLGKS